MEQTLEEKRDAQLKRLKYSIQMYENTLRATVKRMREETNADGSRKYTEDDIQTKIMEIKNEGENDVITQYQQLGGDMAEIAEMVSDPTVEKPVKKKNPGLELLERGLKGKTMSGSDPVGVKTEVPKTLEEKMQVADKKKVTSKKKVSETNTVSKPEISEVKNEDYTYFIPQKHSYDPTKQFDVIPLPSNGECYPSKIDRVPVEHLIGYDENIIFQPNLHRDGKVIDVLLKSKVLGDLDPADMLDGDRDAIVLWLRATGYGNEYPLSVRDEKTGEEFETVADLSTLNFRPFTLKGDENGWFDFTCPVSGDQLKFRFLTHREKERLSQYQKYENDLIVKGDVLNMAKTIDVFIKANNSLNDTTRQYLQNAREALNKAESGIEADDALEFDNAISNQVEMSVMAVNGNTDRKFISDYVAHMPIRDSYALRMFINNNEPGVDFHFTVESPGGGSQDVFLSVNSLVLLNFKR